MDEWWQDHGNLCLLADWMVDSSDFEKGDMANMIEKPWKYEDEFNQAKAAFEQERADAEG